MASGWTFEERLSLRRDAFGGTYAFMRVAGMQSRASGVSSYQSRHLDIGASEVLTLEQQRFAGRLRGRIGETISEVQRGRVVPLAEAPSSAPRAVGMFGRDRHQLNRRLLQQHIELVSRRNSTPAFNNHRRFEHRDYWHATRPRPRNRISIEFRVRLAEQDGEDGRRIDDHLGNPRSS